MMLVQLMLVQEVQEGGMARERMEYRTAGGGITRGTRRFPVRLDDWSDDVGSECVTMLVLSVCDDDGCDGFIFRLYTLCRTWDGETVRRIQRGCGVGWGR